MVERSGLVLVFFAKLIRYVYLYLSERKGSQSTLWLNYV